MPVKGERMGHLHKAIVAAVLAIAFLSVSDAYACTYFFFKAKDGAVMLAATPSSTFSTAEKSTFGLDEDGKRQKST
jgi:penicillin V acylase-like amidase (Ntn superfamily)